jgi:hypothetical protein
MGCRIATAMAGASSAVQELCAEFQLLLLLSLLLLPLLQEHHRAPPAVLRDGPFQQGAPQAAAAAA